MVPWAIIKILSSDYKMAIGLLINLGHRTAGASADPAEDRGRFRGNAASADPVPPVHRI